VTIRKKKRKGEKKGKKGQKVFQRKRGGGVQEKSKTFEAECWKNAATHLRKETPKKKNERGKIIRKQ